MRDEVNQLLGLEGFTVTAVEERGGVLQIEVELAIAAAVCTRCGRGSLEVKERPLVRVRDLSVSGRWTWLRWRKRRYACQACARTFTETHSEIPPRQRMTQRFRRHLFALARSGAAHAEIARNEGTSRYQVARAFAEGASGALAARAGEPPPRRPTRKRGRTGSKAIWRTQLFRARRRLLTARERLRGRERQALCELFQAEPLIAEARGLKEAFRAIYHAPDRNQAEQQLERFLHACQLAAIPSFDAFAAGVQLWREELLAYFDQPITNGYAEGVINKIKVIKRRAYGLPTFEGFRHRILVACA